MNDRISEAASILSRSKKKSASASVAKSASLLGSVKSKKKAAASRMNGIKFGGRPRTYPPCPKQYGKNKAHRFSPRTGRCPCGYVRPKESK